jgi:hypothetical protein
VNDARRQRVDLPVITARLRVLAGPLGLAAIAGAVVEGLLYGLTFAVLARWALVFVAVLAAGGVVVLLVGALGRRRG